jgi:hypothetical protein
MTKPKQAEAVEMVPIERITVINPRVRNKKIFKQITSNIAELGLKRPITVTRPRLRPRAPRSLSSTRSARDTCPYR